MELEMKKILFGVIFLLVVSICQPVYAKSAEVKALNAINTANPPQTMEVQFIEDYVLPDATVLNTGYKMMSEVTNVVSPKRLKKNADFSLNPLYYTDNMGLKHKFKHKITAEYTTSLDTAGLAKSAALTVGNCFVKGLSMGVAAVEGAVDNEEGNVAKSVGKSVYEASPFSYVEKGQDLDIKVNDKFLLKFSIEEEK